MAAPMKANIGSILIPKIKPQGKQYDIRDIKLKGFLIRVTPSGGMTYVCEHRRGKESILAK